MDAEPRTSVEYIRAVVVINVDTIGLIRARVLILSAASYGTE